MCYGGDGWLKRGWSGRNDWSYGGGEGAEGKGECC